MDSGLGRDGGYGQGGKCLGGRVALIQAGVGDLLSTHGSTEVQPRLRTLQEKVNTQGVTGKMLVSKCQRNDLVVQTQQGSVKNNDIACYQKQPSSWDRF